jgi:hypothetical protein
MRRGAELGVPEDALDDVQVDVLFAEQGPAGMFSSAANLRRRSKVTGLFPFSI